MENVVYFLLMNTFQRQTPDATTNKAEISTAERFYDLEESQKRYQELFEENMWLKQQIDRNRNISSPSIQTPQCYHHEEYSLEQPQHSGSGDMVLWGML